MALRVPDRYNVFTVLGRVTRTVPEAFHAGVPKNLVVGQWMLSGREETIISPVDGSSISAVPKLDSAAAGRAVVATAPAHTEWGRVPLKERRARVTEAVEAMTEARDDLALLLSWEIGKPWKLACADVDRALSGVRWYLENIEEMLGVDSAGREFERRPLSGPVNKITSWNYSMSVLVHSELVQLLAGNAVIAKTPTQGGALCLTVANALMARAGLPMTLLSGGGSELSDALIRSSEIGAVAFVGGRSNGGRVSAQLDGSGKRYMLEQEGLNCWGIWECSDWELLGRHLRKGFEYAKQRCTACPRFVVQRKLVDQFLSTYLPVVQSVRIGHPLAMESVAAEKPRCEVLPDFDFGPLISAAKAVELDAKVEEELRHGAVPLYRGTTRTSLPGRAAALTGRWSPCSLRLGRHG